MDTESAADAASSPSTRTVSDFGPDVQLTEELNSAIFAAESQPIQSQLGSSIQDRLALASIETVDIEGIVPDERSLFERFRKRGFLSVSDLVGTVWCEVQVRYWSLCS